MVKNMENLIFLMDDLGGNPTIFGNIRIVIFVFFVLGFGIAVYGAMTARRVIFNISSV